MSHALPYVCFTLLALLLGCNDEADCGFEHCEDVPRCVTDADCHFVPCGLDSDSLCCSEIVECTRAGVCAGPTITLDNCGPPLAIAEGWESKPGSGHAFAVRGVEALNQVVANFDDDGCDERRCLENSIGLAAEELNESLARALEDHTEIVEITGLDEDFQGFDRSVTVRFYSVEVADDGYHVAEADLDEQGVPTTRISARVRNNRLESVATEPLVWNADGWVLEVDRVWLNADLTNPDRLEVGGVVLARSLALVEDPCTEQEQGICNASTSGASTLLDRLAPLIYSPGCGS